MCFECYKAILSKGFNGESEAVSDRRVHGQAAARPGGLQDALKRHPLRTVGFREDRSPRVDDPRAVPGLLRAGVCDEQQH